MLARAAAAGLTTKSGIVAGMGETFDEVVQTLADLAAVGVDIVTIGQYLRPTSHHLPVERWWTPADFDEWKRIGERELGIAHVESSPLTRSSYHARERRRRSGADRVVGRGSLMATTFPELATDAHASGSRHQHVFFVASAPLAADGHVNLSPKGYDTFRVIDPSTVAYLDLTGSGVETSPTSVRTVGSRSCSARSRAGRTSSACTARARRFVPATTASPRSPNGSVRPPGAAVDHPRRPRPGQRSCGFSVPFLELRRASARRSSSGRSARIRRRARGVLAPTATAASHRRAAGHRHDRRCRRRPVRRPARTRPRPSWTTSASTRSLVSVGPDLPWLCGYEAMPLERLTMLSWPATASATLVVPASRRPGWCARDHFEIVPWGETDDPIAIVADRSGHRDGGVRRPHLGPVPDRDPAALPDTSRSSGRTTSPVRSGP